VLVYIERESRGENASVSEHAIKMDAWWSVGRGI